MSQRQSPAQLAMLFACALVLFSIGVAASSNISIGLSWKDNAAPESGDSYEPRYRHIPGVQLALVYIGSSTCAGSNHPEMSRMVRSIQSQVREYADEVGASFISIGAATDWRPERAYAHLTGLGRFEEMVLGGNWANPAILAAIWEADNPATVPAIAVLARHVVTPDGPLGRFEVQTTEVLFFTAGLEGILQHEASGIHEALRRRTAAIGQGRGHVSSTSHERDS
jgi:hypothetical protein